MRLRCAPVQLQCDDHNFCRITSGHGASKPAADHSQAEGATSCRVGAGEIEWRHFDLEAQTYSDTFLTKDGRFAGSSRAGTDKRPRARGDSRRLKDLKDRLVFMDIPDEVQT